MYRAGRVVWGLVAIGAATAVGVATENPGFVAITFIGTLVLPRVLGIAPRGWNRRGYGARGMGWHGGCAGEHRGADAHPTTPASQSV